MDRLVPVEGDDRSTFIAVDAPTKVDVVAERAAPVFFRVARGVRRVRPFLGEQRPETTPLAVPLRVRLLHLGLRQP